MQQAISEAVEHAKSGLELATVALAEADSAKRLPPKAMWRLAWERLHSTTRKHGRRAN